MPTLLCLALLLLRPLTVPLETQGAAVPGRALDAARFLLGDWEGEGGGAPGQATGGFSFSSALQGRVIVRKSWAEYPPTGARPAYRHDDLMVIYAGDRGSLRADFYDNEGHVIRYSGNATPDGSLALTSEIASGAPRFRLSYKLGADGLLAGRFEIAPPSQPEAFAPYLDWKARRKASGRPLEPPRDPKP